MITSLSHATLYVTDHEQALDFYVKTLGFEVRMDQTMAAKGVRFMQEPTERPYGIEAVFQDPFGNWFSLTQPRASC